MYSCIQSCQINVSHTIPISSSLSNSNASPPTSFPGFLGLRGTDSSTRITKPFTAPGSLPPPPEHIDLVVDGGPESNNRIVSAHLEDTPIKKLIARVEVSFSNSMIEAVNKILKYRYIARTQLPDLDHLNETIAAAIEDNNDRPHYALKGLSPNQAYTGSQFDKADYRESLIEARIRRLMVNRQLCDPCVPLDLDSIGVIQ
jgi:hypothetical protein